MRILKVAVSYPKTHDTHIYTFGTAECGNSVLVGKTKRLGKHLEYCFGTDSVYTADVAVDMDINGDTYVLTRSYVNNSHSTTLERVTLGVAMVVARNQEALDYVQNITHCPLIDIIKSYYISSTQFEQFDGQLNNIEAIALYDGIIARIEQSSASLESRRNTIREQAQNIVGGYAPSATKQDVEDVSQQLNEVNVSINEITTQLSQLKADHATSVVTGEIMTELAKAQSQYDTLASQKDYIEEQREQIAQHDRIASLLPKIDRIATTAKQSREIVSERAQLTKQLQWQENELSSATIQLEVKQQQATTVVDKRSKIEVINQELSTIASLYSDNKLHNEKLVELAEQEQRLSAEKVMLRNKLSVLEGRIVDIKKSISSFSVPEQSIGELIESARIDVKVDEVQAQIDKLTSELSIKESQIAEKESNLVVQVKKFRSVAELDVAVSPIKAKDTILQVLDAKYNKLDNINKTLLDKQRNLQRSLEDYRYRILELEHSKAVLDKSLASLSQRKQEEFKREVYLNSQKVYSDDASAVFAVVNDLEDHEVSTMRQDITKRTVDRDVLVERASELEGRIAEIARQMDINSAEMATLRGEKANINTRYNEIVANNRSEAVFNYLKALESNNGTKYLLDVQHDAVRNEAELAELKRNTDALRSKLSGLQSRHRYLLDTQTQLTTHSTLDSLVASNDKLRGELVDIGDRLSLAYEQHRSINDALEGCESKLAHVRAEIVEFTKTVKVNEKQIELSNQKARTYAGNDDLEQAISNFRYEITDVESERQMLVESRRQLESDVFRSRLELEKLQYLANAKQAETDTLRDEINFELSLLGLTLDSVRERGLDRDMSQARTVVADYDNTRSALAMRIDNYYSLLSAHNNDNIDSHSVVAEISALQGTLDELTQQQQQLEQRRAVALEQYAIANNSKIRFAVAATSAESLGTLSEALEHNDIIKLLVHDKVDGIVKTANGILTTLQEESYTLSVQDGMLNIASNGITVAYADMPSSHQFALYLSLIFACPDCDASAGRWIALDDKLPLQESDISDMLSCIQDLAYPVHYVINKGANV